MTSTKQHGDSTTKGQGSDDGLLNTDTLKVKGVRKEPTTTVKAQTKPGAYITVKRRLIPIEPGKIDSLLHVTAQSKDPPAVISQSFSLSPYNAKKALITKKILLPQKQIIGVNKRSALVKKSKVINNEAANSLEKNIGNEVEKNTEETLNIVNIKRKFDNKINEPSKKLKIGDSNKYLSMSPATGKVTFKESKLKNKSEEDFYKQNSVSIEEGGDSTPEYIYETLEDEDDHDYSSLGHLMEIRREHVETNKQNLSEEEITEDQSIQISSDEEWHEDSEEETSSSSLDSFDINYKGSKKGFKKEFEGKLVANKTAEKLLKGKTKQQNQSHTSLLSQTYANESGNQVLSPFTSKSVGKITVSKEQHKSEQGKKPRINDKFPELPVPHHINQYGDCLKTRLGRIHYGLTLNDPPCQFFQGVLKGASGQTLAVMFGDVNLFAKFESISSDEIGHFMIDNTFKAIPSSTDGVNQVITISLLHQNVVIPLWYAITSCSSPELFKRILIEFQQHVLDWPFLSFLTNNDPYLCKAVRAVFPHVDIYGSWFHYCYSIWKEVNLQNLAKQCKTEDSMLLMAVKLLMVVPYLPPSTTNNSSAVTMVDGFEYVREFARENSLPKEFNKVLDYVAVFWFNKVKPENFTVFGKHTCTVNHVEVLQLLLISYMKQNGNVWLLTRSFQSIAKSAYSDLIRYLNGKRLIAKKSRGKRFRFNVPIRLNIKKLIVGSLDVKSFLKKSTIYLDEILDIFLHPLYPTIAFEKTNYIHTEGWSVRISSD